MAEAPKTWILTGSLENFRVNAKRGFYVIGFKERRRTFAIAGALGAKPRQLGGFVWGESLFVTVAGLLLGTIGAVAISLAFPPLPTRDREREQLQPS